MAKQTINIGASPNDGTGTPLRTSFDYTNQNFTELYTATGPSGNNIVCPGTLTVAAGTLALPSLTTAGDTNTGIYFPAADTIGFVEGGAEAMRINSGGNLVVNNAATITGDLTVDTSTLKVDSTNNRVIVGHTSGLAAFQVTNAGAAGLEIQPTGVNSAPAILSYNRSGAAYTQLTLDSSILVHNISGTTAMTLNATGNLILKGGTVGANGVGVTFPAVQVASSDANTLDDYEEGTWTPTISASSGAFTTVTVNSAKYTKIGRRVSIDLDISIINIGTASGVFFITLPFSRSGDDTCGVFREISITGSMGSIYPIPGDATRVGFNLYNNGSVIVNSYRLNGTYTYNV